MAGLFDFLNTMIGQQPNMAQLDPWTKAQMMAESGGNPMALSPKGAAGVMQIMPDTARDPGYGVKPLQGWDGQDPRTAPINEQIRFGQDYQKAMEKLLGSKDMGLAGYNAGPGRMQQVMAGKARMPQETANYIADVNMRYNPNIAKAPKLQQEQPLDGMLGPQEGDPSMWQSNPMFQPAAYENQNQGEKGSKWNNPDLWERLGRFGAGMAKASGPSRMPVTFGMAMAGGQEYMDEQNNKDALLDARKSMVGSGGGGTTMAVYNLLRQQYPNADPMTLLRIAQNKVGTDLTVDPTTGTVNPMQNAPDARGQLKGAERNAINQSDQNYAAEIERQKTLGQPIPAAAQADINENLTAAGSIGEYNKDLANYKAMLEDGRMELGPIDNLFSAGRNLTGQSNAQSRNYGNFKADLEKLRNESLRLNKGVQTEGDAQRIWNELVSGPLNDNQFVASRLQRIMELNDRAAKLKESAAGRTMQNYGRGAPPQIPQAPTGNAISFEEYFK